MIEIILSNIISNIFCKQKKGIPPLYTVQTTIFDHKGETGSKLEHRTFIKPKELEDLPPGTKVSCVFFLLSGIFPNVYFGFFIFN